VLSPHPAQENFLTPKSRFQQYLAHLDGLFAMEPEFYPFKEVLDELPQIVVMVYPDCPEPGYLTGVTYGLSEANHPEWTQARAELMISVKSSDRAWPLAIGELVRQLRGNCPFRYGDVIGFGEPVSAESKMSAFVVFAPSIFDAEDVQSIAIDDYQVCINGLYPLYESERSVIPKVGLQAFWHHPNFDLYDIKRGPVAG